MPAPKAGLIKVLLTLLIGALNNLLPMRKVIDVTKAPAAIGTILLAKLLVITPRERDG